MQEKGAFLDHEGHITVETSFEQSTGELGVRLGSLDLTCEGIHRRYSV